MEQKQLIQWVGIIVVVVMAFSMIAAGFLYNSDPSSTTNNSATIPASTKSFTYTTTFDSQILKELNSLKFAASTKLIDKAQIDSAVSKVEGVSKVSSSFRKTQDSNDTWYYIAEVSLKRDFGAQAVAQKLFALDVFEPNTADGLKYVTVSAPKIANIYNADLNITRDYNFTSTTLPAMVSLTSLPSDLITIEGTLVLQGTALTSLELSEKTNQTNTPKTYSIQKTLTVSSVEEKLLFDGSVDQNTAFDENALKADLKAIDPTAEIYVFDFGSAKSIYGQGTMPSKSEQIKQLFESRGLLVNFTQPMYFDLNTILIPELGKEYPVPGGKVSAQLSPGKKVGDSVALTLEVSVQRDEVVQVQGKE